MKRYIIAFIALLLIIPQFTASATEVNVTYDGTAGKFVFASDGSGSLQSLFPNFQSIMPGGELTQIVKVKNIADDHVKVKLYISVSTAFGQDDGDLVDQLSLGVSVMGVNPMFEPVVIDSEDEYGWQQIGVLYSGGDVDLQFLLSVPETLGNEYASKEVALNWKFMAVEMPVDEPDWVCPVCHHSRYHIDDSGENAVYVCDNCHHHEDMLCEICGKKMKKVVVSASDGKDYYYYECIQESGHHTDPTPPTGDTGSTTWIILMVVCAVLILFIIFGTRRRKVRDDDDET